MYAIFDKNNNRRIPSVILCSPSGEKLYSIPEAKDRQLSISLTELSEFTFEVPKLLDEKGTISPSYNLLETRRVISLEGIGQFIITTVETETDGIEEYKTVTCKGLEFEISSKNIDLLENSYSFYNPLKKEESLIDIILSYIPNWKVGSIDSDLWSVKRYFDIEVTNLYNFMMETVQEAYDCVFLFDTFNRTISAKKRENMVTKTDIFMSYNNLVKSLKLTEDSEDIVTALDVCGDGDLTISSVNPLGTSTLYDFSYYATENWMSASLIKAIQAWETKRTTKKETFKGLKTQHNTFNEQLIVLKSQKTDLQTELASLEHRLALASVAEDSATCTEVSALIETKKTEITNKEAEITNKENQIKAKAEEIKQLSSSLSFETNFTAEQIKELSFFIYRSKLQNTNYAVLDSMSYAEKQKEMESLFEYGEKKLKDVSQPTYTCTIDSVNFLNLIEFKKTIEEFQLGAEITIEVDRQRDLFIKMVLLGYKLNLDDKTDLDLEFGNKVNFKSLNFTYEDLFNKTSSISQSFDTESNRWGLGAEAYDSFNKYKSNALNLLNQEIISSENQEILINQNGIRGREWIESLKTYSGEQFWLNKNILAFSDDGFKTTKTAFGKIFLPDGSRAYGVIADALVGNIVYTKYLTCENENGSFKVDGSSVTIKNGNILMTTDEGVEAPIEDVISKVETEASKNLADAVLDITTNMGNMEEALIDSMIDIFYQPRKPLKSDGKEGDLWFDITPTTYTNSKGETVTTKKNEGYVKVNGEWQPIKDKGVLEALEKADIAQTTADGKITTYFQDSPPIIAEKDKINAIGDLWFDSNDGYRQYRWNGTAWIDIHDGRLDTVETNLVDAIDTVYQDLEERAKAIEDGMIDIFYQPRAPKNTEGKDGDLWYDTSVVDGVAKNEGYLKKNNVWVQIKDKQILDALQNAEKAQTTADGKITTFYLKTFPTKTSHPNLDEGDILIHTGEGNKQYRYDGTSWVNIQDQAINAVSKELGDKVAEINKNMGNMQEAIEDGMIDIFYQPRAPIATDGKNGDLWYDISTTTYTDSKGQTITTKKNEGYLKVNGAWQPIKDKTVLEALEKAHTAQDTADGKITSYYCAKSALPAKPCEGDLWFDTANKNKPYVYRGTTWVSAQDGTIADAQKTATDALNKINNVIDKTTGEILADKLIGSIEAGKNNIVCVDNTSTKTLKMNEAGILIANSKTSTGAWNWKTAISADGILAEAIKAQGTLSGLNILGGTLNIGSEAFKVDSSGNVTITRGSIKLGTDAFVVDSSGNVSMTKGSIKLGKVGTSYSFSLDNDGNVTMKKGSIDIGNGQFTVNNLGDVVARSLTLTETGTTGTVDADKLTIKNLVVGGNVLMGPDAKITWSQVTGKENVANKGDLTWNNIANKPDLATPDDITWANLGGKPEIPELPTYIESTQITRAKIESPTIVGEVVNSATFNGGVYRTWKDEGSVFGGQMDATGLHVYNGATQIGDFTYTNENVGGNPNAVLIQSKSNYAMKISSGEANMSIKGKKIYIEGTLILNGTEITGNGNAVFG